MAERRDGVWRFAEICARARSAAEVGRAFLAEVSRLGFAHTALCSHVSPDDARPGVVFVHDYPMVWIDRFIERGYHRIDPVFSEASRRRTPFAWDEPRFRARLRPDQLAIFNEAAEVGLTSGYSVPIRSPGALPASCSLVAGLGGVDPAVLPSAHAAAAFAHETAHRLAAQADGGRGARLTERERVCLAYVARGKSDWVISQVLGVSERAVHHTIERAKRRLGVSTRVQVVVRALLSGEIAPGDVME